MIKVTNNISSVALVVIALLGLASASANQIESGAFTLTMNVPEVSKKEIILAGTLERLDDRFTFETVDAGGDPITLQGKITKKGVLMWIGKDERDHLITFHLTGVPVDGGGLVASGKVSIFKDHESALGEWQLRKTK